MHSFGSKRSMTNTNTSSSAHGSFHSENSGSMRRGSSRNNSMLNSNGEGSPKESELGTKKVMRFKVYKEAKQTGRLEKYPTLVESVSLALFVASKRLFDLLVVSKMKSGDPFAFPGVVPAGRRRSSSAPVPSPDEFDLWASFRAVASKRNTKILQHAVVVALEHVLEGLMTVHMSAGTTTTKSSSTSTAKDDPAEAVKDLLTKLEEPMDGDSDDEILASDASGDAVTLPYVQVGRCLSARYRELQLRQQATGRAGKDAKKRKPLTGRDLVVARIDREHPRLPFWHAPVPPERPPALPRVPSPMGIRPGTATKERLDNLRFALTPRLPSAKRKEVTSPELSARSTPI